MSSLRQPQGYCFIEFYDEKDAEYAKRKLDGERLNGRSIAVVWAKVRTCGRNFYRTWRLFLHVWMSP